MAKKSSRSRGSSNTAEDAVSSNETQSDSELRSPSESSAESSSDSSRGESSGDSRSEGEHTSSDGGGGGRGRGRGRSGGGSGGRSGGGRSSRRRRSGGGNRNGSYRGSKSGSRGGGGRRGGQKRTAEPVEFDDAELTEGVGLLELHPNGYGFLRDAANNYSRERSDPFVPGTMIEKFGLRPGVMIKGMVQPARRQQGPRLRLDVLVQEDISCLVQDAEVHGSGMQVDAAVELTLFVVESHHQSPW